MNSKRLRVVITRLFALGALLPGILAAQSRIGSGDVKDVYMTNCANCHGRDLAGGSGGSLIDDEWKYGGSDAEIAAAIRDGAQDYLVKGEVDAAGLVRAIRYALVRSDDVEPVPDADEAVLLTDPHGRILQADLESDRLIGLDLGSLIPGNDKSAYPGCYSGKE